MRRIILPAVLMLLLALIWLPVGCGGQGGDQEQEGADQDTREHRGTTQEGSAEERPFTGSFVGGDIFVIEDNRKVGAFLALVAEEPEDGEDQRQVRAYLCDGKNINEWFDEGSVEETQFDLSSDSGARLRGSLNHDVDSSWISGQISLADGTVLGFGAPPARGISGLYDVNVSNDGRLRGTSENGERLEGTVADGTPVTITPPDGKAVGFGIALPTNMREVGEYRWIVLAEDGQVRIKGNKKSGSQEGFSVRGVGS